MIPEDLRVLIITKAYPNPRTNYFGGAFVADQAKFLSRQISSVKVVCPIPILPPKSFRPSFKVSNVSVDFRYYFPGYISHQLKGDWLEHLTSKYVEICEKIINKSRYDVIHAHFSHPCGSAAVILGKKLGIPVVLTIHEDSNWLKELIIGGDPNYTSSWRGADLIIRVNKNDVVALREFNKNARYLPNGYDSNDYFIYRPSTRVKNRIFAMGMLEERKGYQDLIKTIGELKPEFKNIECFIAGGDAGFGKHLQNLINTLNLRESVQILGPISSKEARDHMNKCSLFCHPSKSESFGIVQIEAMACGAPVVATFNGGSELIIEKETGIVVQRDLLKDAIKSALTRNWDNEAIAKAAAAVASQGKAR